MTFIDYFLGQPTQYDNNNQVVKRDFGIMNLLLIVFTVYVLYNLFGKKNKNQRGGGEGEADWRRGARNERWRSWFKNEHGGARGWVIFILIVVVFVVLLWLYQGSALQRWVYNRSRYGFGHEADRARADDHAGR